MRYFGLVAAVAAVSFFPLAANAAALSIGVNASVGASVGVAGGSQSGGTSGSAGGTAGTNVAANASGSGTSAINSNALLNAFGTTNAAATAVANLQSDSVVQVVPVGVMINADPATFANAISQNASATADLQAAITAKSDFAAQLAGSGVSVNSVIAGNVNPDGALVLYTKS